MNSEAAQHKRMTESNLKKLIVTLAIPTIISMLVSAAYNMADTYFVSKLGKSASGAVGIVFSLMAMIQAVGFTLGMGTGSIVSRVLGEKNIKTANDLFRTSFFTAIVAGLLFAIAGMLFAEDIVYMLGATDTVAPFAIPYAKIIMYGAPIMATSFVMNNVLRAQGRARLAMVGIVAGSILNIVLDPIFVFVFGMGIAGAAIATVISQGVSFVILLCMFLGKNSIIKLGVPEAQHFLRRLGSIIRTGFPSFCRQGLATIATVLLNYAAKEYGDAAIAGMSIASKVFMIVFSIQIGFGQGYQPVVGYNFGAQKFERVREAFWFSIKMCFMIMLASAVVIFFFSEQVMRFFIEDAEVIKIGGFTLKAQSLVMPLLPLGVICNMTFQTIGQSGRATLLSSARQGIFFFPLILILPRACGLFGVEIAQAASDLLTFVAAIPFTVMFIKELNGKIKNSQELPKTT